MDSVTKHAIGKIIAKHMDEWMDYENDLMVQNVHPTQIDAIAVEIFNLVEGRPWEKCPYTEAGEPSIGDYECQLRKGHSERHSLR